MELPAEFRLIADHFRPLAGPEGLGLTDDAAVFAPPAGHDLVISTDAMVEHTHFLPETDPALLARKLLRVNLSDLAAMGARPLGYLLTLCLPNTTTNEWLHGFAGGLAQDQKSFNFSLFGGDTTGTRGPIMVSVTIIGAVAVGQAVTRAGARPGDLIYVTGTIGDGILGLAAARGEIEDPDGYLAGRYRLPMPRNALPIVGIASAAMDVSDGLVQELGHIARASRVAMVIRAAAVPLSAAAQRFPERLAQMLAGGDDYELVLTVPPAQQQRLIDAAAIAALPLTLIGECVEGEPQVLVLDHEDRPIEIASTGWSHF